MASIDDGTTISHPRGSTMIFLDSPAKLRVGVRMADAGRSPRSEPLADGVATSAWHDRLDTSAHLGTRLRRCSHAFETFAG